LERFDASQKLGVRKDRLDDLLSASVGRPALSGSTIRSIRWASSPWRGESVRGAVRLALLVGTRTPMPRADGADLHRVPVAAASQHGADRALEVTTP